MSSHLLRNKVELFAQTIENHVTGYNALPACISRCCKNKQQAIKSFVYRKKKNAKPFVACLNIKLMLCKE